MFLKDLPQEILNRILEMCSPTTLSSLNLTSRTAYHLLQNPKTDIIWKKFLIDLALIPINPCSILIKNQTWKATSQHEYLRILFAAKKLEALLAPSEEKKLDIDNAYEYLNEAILKIKKILSQAISSWAVLHQLLNDYSSSTLINQPVLYGYTLLQWFKFCSDKIAIKYLLKNGAKPNLTTESENLIHLSITSWIYWHQNLDQEDIIKLFIDYGIKITDVNDDNETPLDALVSSCSEHMECLDFANKLQNLGANFAKKENATLFLNKKVINHKLRNPI